MSAILIGHPLVTIALILFFEELGVPSPLPGDVMMLFAGVQAARGDASLWSVLLIEELATLAGASLLYLGSRRIGRPLVVRYGPYVGLGPERLAATEARLRRQGWRAVVVGRMLPGTRILTVIAAGVVDLPARDFLPALVIGSSVYLSGYTMIGFWVGPTAVQAFERLALPVTSLLSLALLVVIVVALRAFRRSRAAGAALYRSQLTSGIAGLVAGFTGLLAANVAVEVAILAARLSSSQWDFSLLDTNASLRLLLGWPLFLGAALAAGVLHGQLLLRGWRLFPRLAFVAGLPLVATLLLFDPLSDTTSFDLAPSTTLLVVAGALVRWLTFASVLTALPAPSAPAAEPPSGAELARVR